MGDPDAAIFGVQDAYREGSVLAERGPDDLRQEDLRLACPAGNMRTGNVRSGCIRTGHIRTGHIRTGCAHEGIDRLLEQRDDGHLESPAVHRYRDVRAYRLERVGCVPGILAGWSIALANGGCRERAVRLPSDRSLIYERQVPGRICCT